MYRETRKSHRELIRKLSDGAFKDHVLTVEQDQGPVHMWFCGKPGTGIYHFRVVELPGVLVVTGDVGNHMLRMASHEPVKWLKDAINSMDYVIEKMEGKKEIFVEGDAYDLLNKCIESAREEAEYYKLEDDCGEDEKTDATAEMAEIIKKAEKFKQDVIDEWMPSYYENDGHKFAEAYCNNGGDPELLQSTMDWDSQVYWTYHCLRKFVELLNESDRES